MLTLITNRMGVWPSEQSDHPLRMPVYLAAPPGSGSYVSQEIHWYIFARPTTCWFKLCCSPSEAGLKLTIVPQREAEGGFKANAGCHGNNPPRREREGEGI